MPRADGSFVGVGWSQKRSDAWERVFGRPAPVPTYNRGIGFDYCNGPWVPVPTQPSREVRTPRFEDELADDQAARDGYNPH